jgi:hypothetical protein
MSRQLLNRSDNLSNTVDLSQLQLCLTGLSDNQAMNARDVPVSGIVAARVLALDSNSSKVQVQAPTQRFGSRVPLRGLSEVPSRPSHTQCTCHNRPGSQGLVLNTSVDQSLPTRRYLNKTDGAGQEWHTWTAIGHKCLTDEDRSRSHHCCRADESHVFEGSVRLKECCQHKPSRSLQPLEESSEGIPSDSSSASLKQASKTKASRQSIKG